METVALRSIDAKTLGLIIEGAILMDRKVTKSLGFIHEEPIAASLVTRALEATHPASVLHALVQLAKENAENKKT